MKRTITTHLGVVAAICLALPATCFAQSGTFSVVPSFGQKAPANNSGAQNENGKGIVPAVIGVIASGVFGKNPAGNKPAASQPNAPQQPAGSQPAPSNTGNKGGGGNTGLPIEAKQLMGELMGNHGEGTSTVKIGTENLISAAESVKSK